MSKNQKAHLHPTSEESGLFRFFSMGSSCVKGMNGIYFSHVVVLSAIEARSGRFAEPSLGLAGFCLK